MLMIIFNTDERTFLKFLEKCNITKIDFPLHIDLMALHQLKFRAFFGKAFALKPLKPLGPLPEK